MKNIIRNIISSILIYVGIMTLVVLFWQLLELAMIGKVNPNRVDSIIGTILTISLYENFQAWAKRKVNE